MSSTPLILSFLCGALLCGGIVGGLLWVRLCFWREMYKCTSRLRADDRACRAGVGDNLPASFRAPPLASKSAITRRAPGFLRVLARLDRACFLPSGRERKSR